MPLLTPSGIKRQWHVFMYNAIIEYLSKYSTNCYKDCILVALLISKAGTNAWFALVVTDMSPISK
jgi:hypothetical protein